LGFFSSINVSILFSFVQFKLCLLLYYIYHIVFHLFSYSISSLLLSCL
jgi:hypothetical protein